jgi:hypothetical protein
MASVIFILLNIYNYEKPHKKLFGTKFGYFIDEESLFDVVQEDGDGDEEEIDEDWDGYSDDDEY